MTADGLGLRIKQARGRQHLKQWQLAERVGVNRKTIDNWENERTRPRADHVAALEAVLGSLNSSEQAPFVPANDDEAAIWAMTSHPEEWRLRIIEDMRRGRARPAS